MKNIKCLSSQFQYQRFPSLSAVVSCLAYITIHYRLFSFHAAPPSSRLPHSILKIPYKTSSTPPSAVVALHLNVYNCIEWYASPFHTMLWCPSSWLLEEAFQSNWLCFYFSYTPFPGRIGRNTNGHRCFNEKFCLFAAYRDCHSEHTKSKTILEMLHTADIFWNGTVKPKGRIFASELFQTHQSHLDETDCNTNSSA